MKIKEKLFNKRKEILLLITVIFIFLFLCELSLMVFPGILGPAVKNQFLTKYNTTEKGIYFTEENTGMRLMKPNFETTAYYNDYYWIHKTDSRGFRNNKEYQQADIILLGDSIIYGHGVNYEQTTGYFLEQQTDFKAYNMARQGDSAFEEKYLLKKYGKELNPKYVFYFFFENDITDLTILLTPKEMEYFVFEQDLNDFSFTQSKKKQGIKEFLFNKLLEKSKIALALYTIFVMHNQNVVYPEKPDVNSLEWQYEEKAIKQMKTFSDSINAEFIIVPLTKDEKQTQKLNEIAQQNQIPIIQTKELMFNEQYRLKNDRH